MAFRRSSPAHRAAVSLLLLTSLGAVSACNAVLGIEEASLDPSFRPGEDAGANVDAAPDGGDDLSCNAYCVTLREACTGLNQQYLNDEACLAYCRAMDLGVAGESGKDTLACRVSFARQARTIEPSTNCRIAGPLGGGVCGSDACVNYCKLNRTLCQDQAFALTAECVTACSTWPFDPTLAVQADEDKNSLNCRNYHLQAAFAAPNQDAIHCPHTKAVSDTCFR
jgi:hypothetical protein